MSRIEQCVKDIVDKLRESSYVDDMGYLHTEGLDPEELRKDLLKIIGGYSV